MATCGRCGGSELRTKRHNGGVYGMNKLPLGKGKDAVVAMDSTVCVECGSVEFTISSDTALAKIAKTWDLA
jgi:hypothetical protein